MTLSERFRAKFVLDPKSGCWLWTASTCRFGYGYIRTNNGVKNAHRVSWEIHRGKTAGHHVLHHCDNPACVNPDHLFLGTHQDNMADMKRKGRSRGAVGQSNARAKLTEENVREIISTAGTVTQRELGEKFGVCQSMISRIINGKNWAVVHERN